MTELLTLIFFGALAVMAIILSAIATSSFYVAFALHRLNRGDEANRG